MKARLEDPSIVILDVRQPQDWNKIGIKIKGAIQENPHTFNDWYYRYPKTKTIVLYGAGPDEYTSVRLAQKMMDKGYTNIYVLKGGWNEWVNAKYPTEPKGNFLLSRGNGIFATRYSAEKPAVLRQAKAYPGVVE